jgi:hypothetical protein
MLSVAYSGVAPASLASFGLAPRSSSIFAKSNWPLIVASSNGVSGRPRWAR